MIHLNSSVNWCNFAYVTSFSYLSSYCYQSISACLFTLISLACFSFFSWLWNSRSKSFSLCFFWLISDSAECQYLSNSSFYSKNYFVTRSNSSTRSFSFYSYDSRFFCLSENCVRFEYWIFEFLLSFYVTNSSGIKWIDMNSAQSSILTESMEFSMFLMFSVTMLSLLEMSRRLMQMARRCCLREVIWSRL